MALDDVVRNRSQLRIGDACSHQRGLQVARRVELLSTAGTPLARGTAPIGRGPLRLALHVAAHPLLRPGQAREMRVRVRRVGPRGRTSAATTVHVALGIRRAP
jgi:hypothetical protein